MHMFTADDDDTGSEEPSLDDLADIGKNVVTLYFLHAHLYMFVPSKFYETSTTIDSTCYHIYIRTYYYVFSLYNSDYFRWEKISCILCFFNTFLLSDS